MIDLLENYLIDQHSSLVDKIAKVQLQSDTIQSQLTKITSVIDSVSVSDIQLENTSSIQAKEKIIRKYFSKSDVEIKVQLQQLQKQGNYISILEQFCSKYLETEKNNPTVIKQKIEELREVLAKARNVSDNLMKREKQRNGTYLEVQTLMISALESYYQKLGNCLKNHLKNLVKVQPRTKILSVDLAQIEANEDLLDSNILKHYIHEIFHELITYEISSRNYTVLSPQIKNKILEDQSEDQPRKMTVQFIPIIFSKEESPQFFAQIIAAVRQSLKIFQQILTCFRNQENSSITIAQKDESLMKIRSQLDYINPYLPLVSRKQLLEGLSTSQESRNSRILQNESQNSLQDLQFLANIKTSDLLVKLKLKGQDGDMLTSTVNLLTKKLVYSDSLEDMEMVLSYLEIIENSKGNVLNLGFFIANQLIENIEVVDQNEKIGYYYIKKLIKSRQSLRNKIHHPTE